MRTPVVSQVLGIGEETARRLALETGAGLKLHATNKLLKDDNKRLRHASAAAQTASRRLQASEQQLQERSCAAGGREP